MKSFPNQFSGEFRLPVTRSRRHSLRRERGEHLGPFFQPPRKNRRWQFGGNGLRPLSQLGGGPGLDPGNGAGAYRFSTAWPRIHHWEAAGSIRKGFSFTAGLWTVYFPEGSNPGYASTTGISHRRCRKRRMDKPGHRDAFCRIRLEGFGGTRRPGETCDSPQRTQRLEHPRSRNRHPCSGASNASACFASAHHLNLSHGLVSRELKICQSDLQLGPVVSLQPVIEQDRDQTASERLDALWNKMFLDPVFSEPILKS